MNSEQRPQIPAGTYELMKFSGNKWKNTLEIIVPGHTYVLFHVGNKENDSEMCVLLGSDPGYLVDGGRKWRAILGSRKAFNKFKDQIVPVIRGGDEVEFINYFQH